MPSCSTCSRNPPPEEFIYKGKSYKTCNSCRAVRTPKKNEPVEIISLHEISNHIANAINNLENQAELSLIFHIRLDDVTLSGVGTDVKLMTKLIIDEIEEGDGYNWAAKTAPNLSARHHGVGNAYFSCSQSNELEREFKDSSRKRILRYNCGDKISIKIDIPAAEAKVTLKHDLQHDKPIEVTTPHEIKKEITRMFFDRQLNNYCALCFQLETDNTTAIGFTTSLLEQSHYEEVHCDATYKTSKRRFELYGLIDDVEGTGFPLAYLILDTTKSSKNEQQQGLRTEALTGFFQSLCNKGLNPICFYTDKDFAEITAAKNHIEKAIKEKLKSHKKIERINYNYEEVVKEFSFVDPLFIPDLQRMDNEYYSVCPPDLHETVVEMNIRLIYSNFKRQSDYPFLIWNRSELQVPENIEVFRTHSQVNIFDQHDTNENYGNIIKKHQILESKILALQRLVDHLNEERIANNLQHVEAVVNNLNRAFTILSDIEKAKNQRTRSTTWRESKPWTIFLSNNDT
ncbi:7597_t:CDS:2 [Cetraspora pellucida]|uniref:7597_t:CDS:1 n=1 Tax=Cetraspora pellucida TaxID=1433469 RepID=A0ACA9K0N6_9GLOM|nr:7597_t:CDS:2 [Cetraspora pellucida]